MVVEEAEVDGADFFFPLKPPPGRAKCEQAPIRSVELLHVHKWPDRPSSTGGAGLAFGI